MLFNSWTFWLFLSIVLSSYWLLPHRSQNIFLVFVNYIFDGWWDWRFLPLIAFSTVMDFTLGNLVAAAPIGSKRDWYGKVSVILNLLLLGFFKNLSLWERSVRIPSLPLSRLRKKTFCDRKSERLQFSSSLKKESRFFLKDPIVNGSRYVDVF